MKYAPNLNHVRSVFHLLSNRFTTKRGRTPIQKVITVQTAHIENAIPNITRGLDKKALMPVRIKLIARLTNQE